MSDMLWLSKAGWASCSAYYSVDNSRLLATRHGLCSMRACLCTHSRGAAGNSESLLCCSTALIPFRCIICQLVLVRWCQHAHSPEHLGAPAQGSHLAQVGGAQVAAMIIALVIGSAGLHHKVVAGRAFLGLVGAHLLLGDGGGGCLGAALETGLVGDDLAHMYRQAGACAGAQRYS